MSAHSESRKRRRQQQQQEAGDTYESVFEERPTERRMTLNEIMTASYATIPSEKKFGPPRPLITWDPATEGPPHSSPLTLLKSDERIQVKMLPAFNDARTYFNELEGIVDLTVLQGYGWYLPEDQDNEPQLDPHHTTYRLWRDDWHMVVATHEDHTLAYWVMCGSVPQA